MAISVAPTRDHGHSCRDNQEAGVRSSTVIHIVGCHAEGEVGDVIVGGVAPPPGATLWEQSRWVARDGRLRNLVLNEPRGGVFRHVNLLDRQRLVEGKSVSVRVDLGGGRYIKK